jgi:hypothetical protein
MKHRVARLAFALGLIALAACGGSTTPNWLLEAGKVAQIFYFGRHAKPRKVTYLVGKRADRVMYEFDRPAACGGCSHPFGSGNPSGRFSVVVFDRATHRLIDFSLCKERGSWGAPPVQPPKAGMWSARTARRYGRSRRCRR